MRDPRPGSFVRTIVLPRCGVSRMESDLIECASTCLVEAQKEAVGLVTCNYLNSVPCGE